MKYVAIIPLRGIKLEDTKNRGKLLFDYLRISNNCEIINQIVNSEDFTTSFGSLSFMEQEGSVYIYGVFDYEGKKLEDGTKILEKFMNDINTFLLLLWFIKDNNVNLCTGYMMIIDEKQQFIYSGKTIRYQSFSNSKCYEECINTFSDRDFDEAISLYGINSKYKSNGDKKEEFHNAYNNFLSRYERAFHLLNMARREQTLVFRIANYTSVIECLLSTSPNSSSNQISTRAALLIRNSYEDRMQLIRFLKQMYAIRSSAYHGSTLSKPIKNKHTYEDLLDMSSEYDEILRILFKTIRESEELSKAYFSGLTNANNEIDKYFSKILFSI